MNSMRLGELADELVNVILRSRNMTQYDGKIHAGYGKYVIRGEYCPKYISINEYSDLANLNEFLQMYTDVTNDDLKKIFKMYPTAFVFYRKLMKHFDDLCTEIREKGMQWILTKYCGDKRFDELKKLTRLE